MKASGQEEPFCSARNPILYGIVGTCLLLFTYWFLGSSRSCQKGVCQTNFEHFFASSPNEIGDTLAGIAGILAFLWIIVTVFLQSKELREARKEYAKMAVAQEKQVEMLIKQGEIFEQEQAERREARAGKLVDEFLAGFCDLIRLQANGNSPWTVIDKNGKSVRHNFLKGYLIENDEDLLKKLAYFPPPILESIEKLISAGATIQSCPSYGDFFDLSDRVFQVLCRKSELAPDQVQRLNTLGIVEIHNWLEAILQSEFWEPLPNRGQVK